MTTLTTSQLTTETILSPLGPLELTWSDRGVHGLAFIAHEAQAGHSPDPSGVAFDTADSAPPNRYAAALERYFGGDVAALEDLPVVLEGSPFQLEVWKALRRIPPGATWSYGELAAAIGHPGASRAVGAANGQNPVAIIVPCHRVIGANGTLTGYGGGIERKQWLLRHEGATFKPSAGRDQMILGLD